MSWVYSDYIEVRKDFIPVFTEEADKANPNAWKSFIPHKGLEEVIHHLNRALERGRVEDKRSLWMRGAYGTGKTYASFVIKHLLEDPKEQIVDYFTGSSSEKMRTIWRQFSSIRDRGPILVPYLSSSSHINSTFKFLAEIQKAVKLALSQRGMTAGVSASIQEKLQNKLTDENGTFSWDNAFNKYRGEFPQFSRAQEVVDAISSGDTSVTETVLEILEKEHLVIATNPQEVKDWIQQVIKVNGLGAIVLIWDEFTDFFANTEQVSGLQEIAHLTSSSPFYLFLITHKALGQFKKIDDQSQRKILERFHDCYFDMNEVTAFHLIAHALRPKAGMVSDWSERKESLWQRIKALGSVSALRERDWKPDQFKDLAPIHPYTAYALARISTQFTSSQRTLFKFLQGGDDASFSDFLANYPRENEYWFTPDRLWDYFFTMDSDLVDAVRTIVHHYSSSTDRIEDPVTLQIFKTIMLFMSVWRQTNDQLLKSTSANLRLAFYGAIDAEQISKSMAYLAQNEILRAVRLGEDNWEFFVWEKNIDDEKIANIRRNHFPENAFETYSRFDSLGKIGELGKAVHNGSRPNNLAVWRQKRSVISATELQRLRSKADPQKLKPYEFGSVFIMALDDSDLHHAQRLAVELAASSKNCSYFVINTAFTETRWKDWVDQKVQEIYYSQEHDHKNVEFHSKRATELQDQWIRQTRNSNSTAYFQDLKSEIKDEAGYETFLSRIVKRLFPYGPETLDKTGTLYKESGWGKAAIEQGLGLQKKGQFSKLHEMFETFEKAQMAGGDISGALARLSYELDRLMQAGGQINISEFWDTVQASPYGFMPSSVSAATMGFALKRFSVGYYWSDCTNCHSLSADKMADLIEAVMKGKGKYDAYEIRKMSMEEEQLCQLLVHIFQLDPEKAGYPDEARKTLRNKIQQIGYPLWSLAHVNHSAKAPQRLEEALQRLAHFIHAGDDSESNGGSAQLNELYDAVASCHTALTAIAKKPNFISGMEKFLDTVQPGLLASINRVGWSFEQLIERIKESMNESVWLWKSEAVAEKLPEVSSEIKFLESMNLLCSKPSLSALAAIQHYKNVWLPKRISLPLGIFLENGSEEVRETINGLHELIYDSSRRFRGQEHLFERIAQHKADIKKLLDDQDTVLSKWIGQHLDRDVTVPEAAELRKQLYGVSHQSTIVAFKEEIEKALDGLERKRLSHELCEVWQELTGTSSPSKWSEKYLIPITWVRNGNDYAELFRVVENADKKGTLELEEALKFMNDKKPKFKILNNQTLNRDYFLNNTAFEYKDLLSTDGTFERYRDYLIKEMKYPIHEWPVYPNELRRLAKKWFEDTYKSDSYIHVVNKIDQMPESDAKLLLRSLAEDPVTGFRILKQSEKEI